MQISTPPLPRTPVLTGVILIPGAYLPPPLPHKPVITGVILIPGADLYPTTHLPHKLVLTCVILVPGADLHPPLPHKPVLTGVILIPGAAVRAELTPEVRQTEVRQLDNPPRVYQTVGRPQVTVELYATVVYPQ